MRKFPSPKIVLLGRSKECQKKLGRSVSSEALFGLETSRSMKPRQNSLCTLLVVASLFSQEIVAEREGKPKNLHTDDNHDLMNPSDDEILKMQITKSINMRLPLEDAAMKNTTEPNQRDGHLVNVRKDRDVWPMMQEPSEVGVKMENTTLEVIITKKIQSDDYTDSFHEDRVKSWGTQNPLDEELVTSDVVVEEVTSEMQSSDHSVGLQDEEAEWQMMQQDFSEESTTEDGFMEITTKEIQHDTFLGSIQEGEEDQTIHGLVEGKHSTEGAVIEENTREIQNSGNVNIFQMNEDDDGWTTPDPFTEELIKESAFMDDGMMGLKNNNHIKVDGVMWETTEQPIDVDRMIEYTAGTTSTILNEGEELKPESSTTETSIELMGRTEITINDKIGEIKGVVDDTGANGWMSSISQTDNLGDMKGIKETLKKTEVLKEGQEQEDGWILHTPGGGPLNTRCPCLPQEICPRVFGKSPEDILLLGQLPICQDETKVRCCGASTSVSIQLILRENMKNQLEKKNETNSLKINNINRKNDSRLETENSQIKKSHTDNRSSNNNDDGGDQLYAETEPDETHVVIGNATHIKGVSNDYGDIVTNNEEKQNFSEITIPFEAKIFIDNVKAKNDSNHLPIVDSSAEEVEEYFHPEMLQFQRKSSMDLIEVSEEGKLMVVTPMPLTPRQKYQQQIANNNSNQKPQEYVGSTSYVDLENVMHITHGPEEEVMIVTPQPISESMENTTKSYGSNKTDLDVSEEFTESVLPTEIIEVPNKHKILTTTAEKQNNLHLSNIEVALPPSSENIETKELTMQNITSYFLDNINERPSNKNSTFNKITDLSSRQSVLNHKDNSEQTNIPIHYGTIVDEDYETQPPINLGQILRKNYNKQQRPKWSPMRIHNKQPVNLYSGSALRNSPFLHNSRNDSDDNQDLKINVEHSTVSKNKVKATRRKVIINPTTPSSHVGVRSRVKVRPENRWKPFQKSLPMSMGPPIIEVDPPKFLTSRDEITFNKKKSQVSWQQDHDMKSESHNKLNGQNMEVNITAPAELMSLSSNLSKWEDSNAQHSSNYTLYSKNASGSMGINKTIEQITRKDNFKLNEPHNIEFGKRIVNTHSIRPSREKIIANFTSTGKWRYTQRGK